MEQVFQIEVSQRKMAAGQNTTHEQSRSFLLWPLMPVQNGKSSESRQEACHIPCAILGGKIHSWPWHQKLTAVNLNSCVARESWL